MAISSIHPSTGKTLQTFEETTDAQVEQKLVRALRAFDMQRKLSSNSARSA